MDMWKYLIIVGGLLVGGFCLFAFFQWQNFCEDKSPCPISYSEYVMWPAPRELGCKIGIASCNDRIIPASPVVR